MELSESESLELDKFEELASSRFGCIFGLAFDDNVTLDFLDSGADDLSCGRLVFGFSPSLSSSSGDSS